MRWISLLVIVFVFSCSNKKDAPDVSDIKADVTIHRFDKDFFALDTSNLSTSISQLEKKYPSFLNFYFEFFAPINDMAQQQNLTPEAALKQYISILKPLHDTILQKVTNLDDIEKELEKNLRYVKHYFPQTKLPAILTSVESFNPENPLEVYGTTFYHDTLVISLQMFLGKDYPVYNEAHYPEYLRRRFEPEYIVPNSFRAISAELYPDSSQSASLIEQMIEKGKQWWLMKKLMPGIADSLITGYTSQQMEWVKKEEGNIWGYINQNENLFSIEPPTIQTYIGEAPFTQSLPHDNFGGGAPGNIGPWIGWQIIEKFEEKYPKLTVSQVLHTTAKKIFAEAKYKPK